MPALSEFQPTILRSLMADAFTLRGEAHAFGYAGSRLRAILQQPLDDHAFDRLWPDEDRRDIRRLLAAVTSDGLPVILQFQLAWSYPDMAPHRLDGEALLVPASDGATGTTAVMGGFALFKPEAVHAERPRLSLQSASIPSRTIARAGPSPEPDSAAASARSWPLRLVGALGQGV
jgi:hypothetical protein